MFESAPVALFVCDRDAIILDYNKCAVELWGREPRRGVDRHCGSLRLFLPDGTELPHDSTPMSTVIRTGVAVRDVEVVIERPDGKRIPVLVSFAPLHDKDGSICGATTSFYDISERKRAEHRLCEVTNELNAEAATLKQLHELSTCLVGAKELHPMLKEVLSAAVGLEGADYGLIQLFNPGNGELEIAAEHEVSANLLAHFRIVEDNHAGSTQALKQRRHLIVEDVETDPFYRGIATSTCYRAAHSTPLYSGTGEPIGVLSTMFRLPHRPSERELRLTDLYARIAADFIERKQAEEALRESEAFLQNVLGASPDCIKVLNLDARLQWMSQNGLCAMEVPGLPAIRGADWISFWRDPDTRDQARVALQVAKTGSLGRFRGFCPTFSGRPKWWDVVLSAIRGPNGSITALLGVSRDVTAHKCAEDELKRTLEDLESRVAARTAELAQANEHLREEINAREKAEETRQLLLDRIVNAEEDERRRLSRELHDQVGQQLTAMMLGLRALQPGLSAADAAAVQQLEAIAGEISREVHDIALDLRPTALDDSGLAGALANYVENWAARTEVEAAFHHVSLERRLPATLETVVYRVVQEALTNVAKHAQAKRVSVVVERRQDHVLAIVEDDGTGFDVDSALNVRCPKRLGLVGMRERAGLCGGTVSFESSSDHGTAVDCRLPFVSP